VVHFSDNWLSELYSKNDIVDVVSSYTTLNERGGRYWGLCPFHNEKTPSFSVSRDKQLYYCFGCKTGGNVTNFIMKTENMTFPEAVEFLAKRVHMEMPKETNSRQYQQVKEKREQIKKMHKIAARYYYDTLHSDAGKAARAYLKKRGIEAPIIKRFGLGYAPDGWSGVTDLLKKEGFSQSLIKESGLVSVKNNNMFDTFRDRVMFPIINTFGDVIAFGGRVMGDGTPKYLNTRETPAFNKRRNLYGLDLVRKMRDLKGVIIVEGYMDVVSLAAHGVRAAVASLGTAFTKEQAILLKRYTQDVFISYDGDEAGRTATMKALGILETEGFNVRVIALGKGVDPDDFIREHGTAGFAAKVKQAYTGIGYRLAAKRAEFNIETEDGKEGYAIAAAKILAKVDSPIRRERYVERVAAETGFSEKAVMEQIGRRSADANSFGSKRYNRTHEAAGSAESAFLAAAMAHPQYIVDAAAGITIDDFSSPPQKNIFSALLGCIKRGIQPTYAELLSELGAESDRSEAARLSAEYIAVNNPMAYLRDCAQKMRRARLEREKHALMDSLGAASGNERGKLLARISELDKELREMGVG